MIFNEQDFMDEIKKIEDDYHQISYTINFFYDNASKLRDKVSEIEMNFMYLRETIKKSEETLLISCYTIAERMLKVSKYTLIGFDSTLDTNIQKFLSNKLNPKTFSPNAKLSELEKTLSKYTTGNEQFKLFFPKDHELLKIYDDMIQERHSYAHKGTYNFKIENYPKVIKVLKYLYFEFNEFLVGNAFKKSIDCIYKYILMFSNINNEQHFIAKKIEFRDFIEKIDEFTSSYDSKISKIELLTPLQEILLDIKGGEIDNFEFVKSKCQQFVELSGNKKVSLI